ncbi:uncharacterized protein LOC143073721 [Mytilus galloprovincialis]|uniref:uncharacterized protein LOC143073721 n=1 Tax=Mytilus galloprovincialis TaxID=29158 RepID=UPI003F7CB49A
MKELFISIIAFQIISFIAEANAQKLDTLPKYYEEKLLRNIKHSLSPEEITIIEKFNNLKDFYPDGERHHVLRKRNAVQSMGEADGTGRRRRRRRRKQKPSAAIDGAINTSPDKAPNEVSDQPRRRQGRRRRPKPSDQPSIKSSNDGPTNPTPNEPRNEIFDKPKRRQDRPRPSAVIQEAPVLSEANADSNDGLLKAKELHANHINTENMRANKLKADSITADRVKAQDVVVTSKKSRGRRPRRPKLGEFIDPSIGIQRINSVTDIPDFDQRFAQLFNKNNYRQFERSMYRQPSLPESRFSQQQSTDNSQMFQQQKIADNAQLFQQQHFSNERYLRPAIETKRRLSQFSQLPPVQPTDVLPEFSSSNILNKIPALSEFIADGSSSVQKGNNVVQQDTLFRGAPPPATPTAFDEFTNMYAQNIGKGENIDQTPDKTAKTYIKKSKSNEPWYF